MSDDDKPKGAQKSKAAPRGRSAAEASDPASRAPESTALVAASWPSNMPVTYQRRRSGLISDMFALRTLSAPRQRRSAVGESGHATTWFIPFPLLSARRARTSAVGQSRFASRSFWPFPLLSTRERKSAVGQSGTVFSDALGWGTLSRNR